MIVKKIWTRKKLIGDIKILHFYWGWYLFGFIPIYIVERPANI